jgi:tetratricopeptide (TPR) repeat protein
MPSRPVELFFSYSHKDEELRDRLATHLSTMKRRGVIQDWHDRRIIAGQEWDKKIDERMNRAAVILLLVSADFLASDYCYDVEVTSAMRRHDAGDAVVIPVILRPCDWQDVPFGKLQVLPKDANPITLWNNQDEAFLDVANGIRRAVEKLLSGREVSPEQSGEAAPPVSRTRIPPPPVFGFVSRRDAQGRDIVARLKEELAPGRNLPVTLSGPGGIGKTTLAAKAARELEGPYDGRVVWSSADGRPDFTLLTLLDDIATQLGRADLRTLAPSAKEEEARALVNNPPALVVLDNYETVAQEGRKRVEAWFKAAGCSALFTSRPKVAGTVFVPVSAMSREEAEEFLERLAGQTQEPHILTPDVRRRIYETAEANPFVMQWVVGQIDEARDPETVFEELAEGEGDAAERVFARSFNLPQLGDDGRDILLALSLFAPSATREALAAAAGLGDDWKKRLDDAVKNLHALWLVKGVDGYRRLTTEGLTRTLIEARLSKDSRAPDFRRRFVSYSLHYAKKHNEWTPENYDSLEAEKDNLLKAAEVAFASEDFQSVMRMAEALANPAGGMLSVRGYWDEAVRLGEQALRAAHSLQDKEEVGRFSLGTAGLHRHRGELDGAQRLYEESLNIGRELNDQSAIALSTWGLGNVSLGKGYLARAEKLFQEALETFRTLEDQSNIAGVLNQLGRVMKQKGAVEDARRLYNESLGIKKTLGNHLGVANTLHELAVLAQNQGELEDARRLYDESLEIKKTLGDQYGVAVTLGQLGYLAAGNGDNAEASRLFREALSIFERLGSPYAEVARRNLKRVEGSMAEDDG